MPNPRYQETLDRLYGYVDNSTEPKVQYSPDIFRLDRVRTLLRRLGNPQDTYDIVHIAGTKGKGSVAALTASSLTAGGIRSGLYTSPHLIRFTERIKVDQVEISEDEVVNLADRIFAQLDDLKEISVYDLITAMGMLYFRERGVEVAVIEVGLGGRLDATNIVHPAVTAITSISLDHTQLLGETLGEIAAEKAGILKHGVPVVVAPQEDSAAHVITQIAEDLSVSVIQVGEDIQYVPEEVDNSGQSFRINRVSTGSSFVEAAAQQKIELRVPLLGGHQVENAAVAFGLLTVLADNKPGLDLPAIARGFQNVEWPGRFQIQDSEPVLIFDVAHNPDSAQKLRETVEDVFPGRRLVLVFGAKDDKDFKAILSKVIPLVDTVFVTKANYPRAQDPDRIHAFLDEAGIESIVTTPVAECLSLALGKAGPQDIVLVTGSIFVVGEAMVAWEEFAKNSMQTSEAVA